MPPEPEGNEGVTGAYCVMASTTMLWHRVVALPRADVGPLHLVRPSFERPSTCSTRF